ncbi:MAG TPA: sigma-70 family RNA polymerase sigma factor, partial [Firmicutes bacterium]|nr:sigma-70 family RNA polymerase sigma factor [Bacillota bacterium]
MKQDTDIIKKVQNGDNDAFGDLVEKYHRNVYNLAYRLTGDREDAMDITQEAFLRVFRSISSFQTGKPFLPWVYRITWNLCADRGRKIGRSLPEESLDGNEITRARVSSQRPAPDQIYETKELGETLSKSIGRLREGYRELIVLFHIDGLSIKEISKIT